MNCIYTSEVFISWLIIKYFFLMKIIPLCQACLKKNWYFCEFLHKPPKIPNILLHLINDYCRRCCARWHQFLLRLPIFHNYLKSFLAPFQRRFLLHVMSRCLFGFSLPFSLCISLELRYTWCACFLFIYIVSGLDFTIRMNIKVPRKNVHILYHIVTLLLNHS